MKRTVAFFYEAVVVIQEEQKLLFYSQAFQQRVIPKYKISGMSCDKAQVPILLLITGLFWIFLSIALFIINQTATIAIGVVLILFGLAAVTIPCYSGDSFYLHIQLSKPKGQPQNASFCGSLFGILLAFLPDPANTISLHCHEQPDLQILMDYTYGNLVQNMEKMHSLSHLIQDDISDRIRPMSLADVA